MARRALVLSWLLAALAAPAGPARAARAGDDAGTSGPEADGEQQPAPEETRPAKPRPRTDLCLIADYLPPLAYAGERLAWSFRVEKRPDLAAEPEFTVSWRFLSAGGKQLRAGSAQGAARERFTLLRGFWELPGAARRLEYALSVGGRELQSGAVLIVREADGWPSGARAGWMGLVGAGGEHLVLVLPERVAKVDERFKPIRWLWKNGRTRADSVAVVGPHLAGPGEKNYLDRLADSAPKLTAVDLTTGGGEPAPEPPRAEASTGSPSPAAAPTRGIYALIEAVESRVRPAAGKTDLVVLVMPQSDPEMGTDLRTYRQGLDWVLARLSAAGAGRVAVLPPLSRGVPEKQAAAYAAVCEKAARVYAESGAKCLDASRMLADRYWLPEGASGKVSGRWPNAEGQEALAKLIQEAYK